MKVYLPQISVGFFCIYFVYISSIKKKQTKKHQIWLTLTRHLQCGTCTEKGRAKKISYSSDVIKHKKFQNKRPIFSDEEKRMDFMLLFIEKKKTRKRHLFPYGNNMQQRVKGSLQRKNFTKHPSTVGDFLVEKIDLDYLV